jgi:TolB-like protein/tetratricopeptide (TPR) repeat protein
MPLLELKTGTLFAGRYQVIEELGRGGMGRVYKVLDKEVEEKVALKLIKPEIATEEETIRRFRDELRLARQITHQNVCRMYDLGRFESTYYLTMEYVSGEDLKSTLKRMGPLSAGKVISVARQIAAGLAEAHRLGIVHRDLKPQNIMVDREGTVRVMDFGIARSARARGETGAAMLVGTPEYMSPEQAEGREVDGRSDIYSLGIILFELLTGRIPSPADQPPDPGKVSPQVPEALSRIILKCLEKDRAARYPSAGDLLSKLEDSEAQLPGSEKLRSAKRTTTAPPVVKSWTARTWVIGAAAVVLLAAIIVAGWLLLSKERGGAIRSLAVLPFESEQTGEQVEYLCDGMMESLIGKLAQLPGLKVISTYSVRQYKGKRVSLQDVGRDLNVQAALTGRIAQEGDKLTVRAELVNVKDNSRLWGDQYLRPVGDIFSIQEEIAKEISQKLRMRLTGEDMKALAKSPTENLEAYRLYLEGRFYWNRRTLDDLRKAIACYERAVALDPDYALGHAGISETYGVIMDLGFEQPEGILGRAEEHALRALALDENLAEAHTALALVKKIQGDLAGSEKELLRAKQLNPNYATARQWLAEQYMFKEDYALAHAEIAKAIELDPNALVMKAIEGQVYMAEGRYDEAIRKLKPLLEKNPEFIMARIFLSNSYLGKADYPSAERTAEECQIPDMRFYLKCRVLFKIQKGVKTPEAVEAKATLERMTADPTTHNVPPALIALIYGDMGDLDAAYRWYERGRASNYLNTIFIMKKYCPDERLKKDPRFKEVFGQGGIWGRPKRSYSLKTT